LYSPNPEVHVEGIGERLWNASEVAVGLSST
jgi:hypothetical protein